VKRALWIVLFIVLALTALGLFAWRLLRPPDPAKILAQIDVPDAPVLSPEEELASFRLAPGFRAELVAAEPLVVDPVAMDWDDRGRLFVVEMRGFMPNINGEGEDRPNGRVVVLEDIDGDGRMDESHIFLDALVLPRAIAVLPEGILIGVPPDLILCRDTNDDLRCEDDEQTVLLEYASDSGNVEHRENALLPGLDGWLYNSKSARRFRLSEAGIEVESTVFRGQWGIAQDDEGRLYYNHNSGFLYADLFPAEYTLRQPATAAAISKPGINVDLAEGEKVFGVRVAPGLNRANQPGTLRRDGRQNLPTAVSGLVIQRGHQFGDEYKGDAFIPESAGSAVAHFAIEAEADGAGLHATHRLYPDEDYGKREFLASTDERFRPVDAKVGPDGAIWIIDMYRGVIQHAYYVSDYLRGYVSAHDLAPPGATGRIWRIVREDEPFEATAPSLESLEDQLAGLDHPNAWVRDRAQRRLIHTRDPAALPSLRRLSNFGALGQRHALWTLAGVAEFDLETWREGIQSRDPNVRRIALRLSENMLRDSSDPARLIKAIGAEAVRALDDGDARVRLQALHTLGSLPPDSRPLEVLLEQTRSDDPLERQAALSSLANLEERALDLALSTPRKPDLEWASTLATAAFMQAQSRASRADAVSAFLDRIVVAGSQASNTTIAAALVDGIQAAQELPGVERVVLEAAHPLFENDYAPTLGEAVLRIRRGFTWEGDPTPGGARPLEPEEERLRARGAELFAETCATCHGAEGRGNIGLAPPLTGSPWVRDADDWLVRIVLQGVRGPIRVQDETWNSAMPGHGHDPRFDDEGLAGLLTFLRRAWGHGDPPVSPTTVARIRRATVDHPEAWTAEELLALPVEHRLDRYVGVYRIPIVGIELSITRSGSHLEIGRSKGARAPMREIGDGLFTGEGLQIRFEETASGPAPSARVQFGSDAVEVSRVDP
jgi:mono/diheme cytochrome c family protein/glucose/arabinose dehydrogenase/HEAT repeat protein